MAVIIEKETEYGIITTTTTGNIALASTVVVSRALVMTYDATTAKWYPSY